jgi:hypothetical protein
VLSGAAESLSADIGKAIAKFVAGPDLLETRPRLAGCFRDMHLGLSESRARHMMREQLATNASDSRADSRYLVPPGCRNGGEYDLHPGSSRFP